MMFTPVRSPTRLSPRPRTLGGVETVIGHSRCCRFGQWYDVVVDDKLPSIAEEQCPEDDNYADWLLYSPCTERGEFWVPLLEKAYAKLVSRRGRPQLAR